MLQVVAIVMFSIMLAVAMSCALGLGASWVLGFFGVAVPWYVCSVALFIIGTLLKSGKSS